MYFVNPSGKPLSDFVVKKNLTTKDHKGFH
jgi:hypothetical protein